MVTHRWDLLAGGKKNIMFENNPSFQNCTWALLLSNRYHQTACPILGQTGKTPHCPLSICPCTNYFHHSFVLSSVRAWNSFEEQQTCAGSLSSFKNTAYLIDLHMLDYSSFGFCASLSLFPFPIRFMGAHFISILCYCASFELHTLLLKEYAYFICMYEVRL